MSISAIGSAAIVTPLSTPPVATPKDVDTTLPASTGPQDKVTLSAQAKALLGDKDQDGDKS